MNDSPTRPAVIDYPPWRWAVVKEGLDCWSSTAGAAQLGLYVDDRMRSAGDWRRYWRSHHAVAFAEVDRPKRTRRRPAAMRAGR
jgi:hypothetical protein